MGEKRENHRLFRSVITVLYFLFPLWVTWLSLSLTSMYMAYYDIGINAVAANGFLLWIVAPILLIALFVTAVVSWYLGRRFQRAPWFGILLGMGLVFMVGMGAFLLQVKSYSDYPTQKQQDMSVFLNYYLQEIGRRMR